MAFLINGVTDSSGNLIPGGTRTEDVKLTFDVQTSLASQVFTVRGAKMYWPDTEFSKGYLIQLI